MSITDFQYNVSKIPNVELKALEYVEDLCIVEIDNIRNAYYKLIDKKYITVNPSDYEGVGLGDIKLSELMNVFTNGLVFLFYEYDNSYIIIGLDIRDASKIDLTPNQLAVSGSKFITLGFPNINSKKHIEDFSYMFVYFIKDKPVLWRCGLDGNKLNKYESINVPNIGNPKGMYLTDEDLSNWYADLYKASYWETNIKLNKVRINGNYYFYLNDCNENSKYSNLIFLPVILNMYVKFNTVKRDNLSEYLSCLGIDTDSLLDINNTKGDGVVSWNEKIVSVKDLSESLSIGKYRERLPFYVRHLTANLVADIEHNANDFKFLTISDIASEFKGKGDIVYFAFCDEPGNNYIIIVFGKEDAARVESMPATLLSDDYRFCSAGEFDVSSIGQQKLMSYLIVPMNRNEDNELVPVFWRDADDDLHLDIIMFKDAISKITHPSNLTNDLNDMVETLIKTYPAVDLKGGLNDKFITVKFDEFLGSFMYNRNSGEKVGENPAQRALMPLLLSTVSSRDIKGSVKDILDLDLDFIENDRTQKVAENKWNTTYLKIKSITGNLAMAKINNKAVCYLRSIPKECINLDGCTKGLTEYTTKTLSEIAHKSSGYSDIIWLCYDNGSHYDFLVAEPSSIISMDSVCPDFFREDGKFPIAVGEFATNYQEDYNLLSYIFVATNKNGKGDLIPVFWRDCGCGYGVSNSALDGFVDSRNKDELNSILLSMSEEYPAVDIKTNGDNRYIKFTVKNNYGDYIFNRNNKAYNGTVSASIALMPLQLSLNNEKVENAVKDVERKEDVASDEDNTPLSDNALIRAAQIVGR